MSAKNSYLVIIMPKHDVIRSKTVNHSLLDGPVNSLHGNPPSLPLEFDMIISTVNARHKGGAIKSTRKN